MTDDEKAIEILRNTIARHVEDPAVALNPRILWALERIDRLRADRQALHDAVRALLAGVRIRCEGVPVSGPLAAPYLRGADALGPEYGDECWPGGWGR